MKYFVATDLHGSAYWTNRVLEKFLQSGADVFVVLGDVYNHGPRNPLPQDYAPLRVAEMLNSVSDQLVVIQGNCDSEVDQMISSFTFLREDVVFCGGRRLFFTHGHVHNKNNLPCLSAGDVLLYGHFHVSEIVQSSGVVCVNVGSPSLPKDGNSAYCIVDELSVNILDFDGNVLCKHSFA